MTRRLLFSSLCVLLAQGNTPLWAQTQASVTAPVFRQSTGTPSALPHPEDYLNRIEFNAPLARVSGGFLVDTSLSGRSLPLNLPQAVTLAKSVARAMPVETISDSSVTEIFIVADVSHVPGIAASPSGKVMRRKTVSAVVDSDPAGSFRRVYLGAARLRENWAFKIPLPEDLFARPPPDAVLITVSRLGPRLPGRLFPEKPTLFVGGLISISGEPPEGFFAAATAAEFRRRGWELRRADEADVWVYRVPDSRPQSYFEFTFPSPDRPVDSPRKDKFKIAVGIGPAHAPFSPGGNEADLLWLGDEQHGTLAGLLENLRDRSLSYDDLYRKKGLALRLSSSRVILSGLDWRHALTQEGFEALETDPELYRRVFSEDYDAYLRSLFEVNGPQARKTYLLGTSRGCSQGCSICASGGLSRFHFFSARRMMRELEKIAARAKTAPGEIIDLFFVDSNFNNNAQRIIEFADLLDRSPLKDRFRFFVRHSSVNGFLAYGADGVKRPREDLIDAYARLGIRQIVMGADAFDDAGVLTLKTNRNALAKKGLNARPTYTYAELRGLIRAIDRKGLKARAFYLTNNPWVSDLDRVDSWYNLLELWLENPLFSIDARERDILRLKPFAGSPIANVAEAGKLPIVARGRFTAEGPLGELDEMMDFSELGRPRSEGGAGAALAQFREASARVRRRAESVDADPASLSAAKTAAKQVLRKFLARDAGLRQMLAGIPEAANLLLDISDFALRHRDLPPFQPSEQAEALAQASQSLIDGLRNNAPGQAPQTTAGYPDEAARLDPKAAHTLKNIEGYLSDNLGKETLRAARSGETRFLILVGDGRKAASAALALGWRMFEPVTKKEGFHRVHRAVDETGGEAYVISRVNGEDRILHLHTLLRLAGLPSGLLQTSGHPVSWKQEYLKTFRSLGHIPDLVLYGFANTAVDSILLRNRAENAHHFMTMVANYDRRKRSPQDGEHDMAGVNMHVLELADGKRVWVFPCLYGDLSRELMEAIFEHGARNVVFMGTAGALKGRKVGEAVVPSELLRSNGRREKLGWLAPTPLPKAGVYQRVPTPNIETQSWAQDAIRRGVDLVEVELEHAIYLFRDRPDVRFRAVLVVSDVLTGPGRKDMTEWGLPQLRALMPSICKVLDAASGVHGDQAWRLRSYKTVPLVPDSGS
ncbi:MAG: hypothetical protein ABIG11_09660 [bacterium]